MKNSNYEIIRQEIISLLSGVLSNLKEVHACWLGGSDANNENDEYSDIDFFICLDDDKIPLFFDEIKSILLKKGELDYIGKINTVGYKVGQDFHIKGTPENLIIEVWILKKSDGMFFEKGHPAFKPKIIFDKSNIIQFETINKEKYNLGIKESIKEQIDLVNESSRITKYIKRDNYIETTNYYIRFMFMPLVEILRIKYTPLMYNWGRIHISRHLPIEIIKKLENLMKFKSYEDIENNLKIAQDWFWENINELKTKENFID